MNTPAPAVTDPLAAARSLRPLVEAEADAAEAAATLTAPVVEALLASGLFGLMVPAELGGAEADVSTCIEVFEELSSADGSTGWAFLANATSSAMAGAFTGEPAARAMFGGERPAVHAGMYAPRGTARAVDGGYLVSGRYAFGSGCGHATWIGGGALTVDGDQLVTTAGGVPEMRVFFVPRERVTFLGNWDVMGLVATGSFDYEVPEQLVDADFTFPLLDATPRRGGPVYRLGVLGLTAAGHAGFALGVGRRALEELVRIAAAKERLGQPPVRDQQLLRHDLGWHDAALRAARAYVLEVFGAAQSTLEAGADLAPEPALRLRQATTYATRVAADAVRFAYTWAGSDALRSPSVLGRCFRDIHAGTQHLFVDNNTLTDLAGLLLDAGRRPEAGPAGGRW